MSHIEKSPIFDREMTNYRPIFCPRWFEWSLKWLFLSIRLTKDYIYNFRETYFRKIWRSKLFWQNYRHYGEHVPFGHLLGEDHEYVCQHVFSSAMMPKSFCHHQLFERFRLECHFVDHNTKNKTRFTRLNYW